MMRDKIIRFLNNQLNVNEIDDQSVNGIQVDGSRYVNRVLTAVDADINSIKRAVELNVNLMIVHHGLFWKKNEVIIGPLYEKVALLIKHNVSLYAVHLPLDIHEEFGNNIQIVKALALRNISKFAECRGLFLGYSGEVELSNIGSFKSFVEESLNTKIKLFNFGSKEVKKVGVVSGAGGFSVSLAPQYGVDTIITGEASYPEILLARDLGINLMLAGHYETEVFGVRAIANKLNTLFGPDGLSVEFYESNSNKNFQV